MLLLLATGAQPVGAQSHSPKHVVGHTNKGNTWDGHLTGERPVTNETTRNSGTLESELQHPHGRESCQAMRGLWGFLHGSIIVIAVTGCTQDSTPVEQSSLQPRLGAIQERFIDSLDHIGDVAIADRGVVLTDVGAHRLLQFNPQGRGRLQGRRGQGPGEFAFPLFVDARGGRVVVGDQGNGRFQQFDRTGVLQRVFNAPLPVRHFAIESDSTILMALADTAWYLARVFEDGRWEPFARRPAPTAASAVRGDHLVAMAGERTVAVFDQELAALRFYGANGDAVTGPVFPSDVAATLGVSSAEQQRVLSRRFGRVLSAPIIKDLAGDGAGHLLLLFSAGTTVGMWIDVPRNRTVSLTTDAADGDDPFWSAVAGDVVGDTLLLVSRAGQVYQRRVGSRPADERGRQSVNAPVPSRNRHDDQGRAG